MLKNNTIYTNYARTAIYLALLSIDVKNKEVLIPAFTCATTLPDAIVQAGGIPVFIDIDPTNLQMLETDILNKISTNVKVVISHHYYGYYSNNVLTIQAIAQKFNLIHIEDFAHCYGLNIEAVGDVAIYSFSKSLNSPGGGKAVFYKENLFFEAKKIQKQNISTLHEYITNFETFNYLNALKRDRSCHSISNIESNKFIVFINKLVIKLMKLSGVYIRNNFYKIYEKDVGKKFDIFDTRITKKQLLYFKKTKKELPNIIETRIKKATELNNIIPSFLPLNNNIFTNYTKLTNDISEMEYVFGNLNIKTRRVWPFFQKYWKAQATETVSILANQLLLVDLDCIDDVKIAKLKKAVNDSKIL